MMWKYLEQTVLFSKDLNWVQHWVSRIGLLKIDEIKELEQWALCSWWLHGTKTAILESKLRTGTSKTKQLNLNFLCFMCPSAQFALQYGGFCTTWSPAAKGSLHRSPRLRNNYGEIESFSRWICSSSHNDCIIVFPEFLIQVPLNPLVLFCQFRSIANISRHSSLPIKCLLPIKWQLAHMVIHKLSWKLLIWFTTSPELCR